MASVCGARTREIPNQRTTDPKSADNIIYRFPISKYNPIKAARPASNVYSPIGPQHGSVVPNNWRHPVGAGVEFDPAPDPAPDPALDPALDPASDPALDPAPDPVPDPVPGVIGCPVTAS